jgi:hypothetical protein
MKLRFLLAGAFVCLAATACGTVSHASVKAGNAVVDAAVTHRTAAEPVVFDCLNHPVVTPADYILACADDGAVLDHLSWLSWTPGQAVAHGVNQINDCTPNCAEGKFINYPATVTFWRPEPLAGHPGTAYFTRLTVHYTTAKRPPMWMNYNRYERYPAQWTEVLGS